MPSILRTIARENFKMSGYLSHPGRDRPTRWEFVAPPGNPCRRIDPVESIQVRRAAGHCTAAGHMNGHRTAGHRTQSSQISFFRNCLHAFFRR